MTCAACLAGWIVAIGMLARYGLAMAAFKKLFSLPSLGAALYVSAPGFIHALIPSIPLAYCATATAFIAVHLFHMNPSKAASP